MEERVIEGRWFNSVLLLASHGHPSFLSVDARRGSGLMLIKLALD